MQSAIFFCKFCGISVDFCRLLRTQRIHGTGGDQMLKIEEKIKLLVTTSRKNNTGLGRSPNLPKSIFQDNRNIIQIAKKNWMKKIMPSAVTERWSYQVRVRILSGYHGGQILPSQFRSCPSEVEESRHHPRAADSITPYRQHIKNTDSVKGLSPDCSKNSRDSLET